MEEDNLSQVDLILSKKANGLSGEVTSVVALERVTRNHAESGWEGGEYVVVVSPPPLEVVSLLTRKIAFALGRPVARLGNLQIS